MPATRSAPASSSSPRGAGAPARPAQDMQPMTTRRQAMSSNGGRWKGREVVIVEAARTPIGRGHREKGYFKDAHPNELLGAAYEAVIERANIEPALVEDVAAGAVSHVGEQSYNIACNPWLHARVAHSHSST